MADVNVALVSSASALAATVETPRLVSGQLQSSPSGLAVTASVATPDFRLNVSLKSGPSDLSTSAGRVIGLTIGLRSSPSTLNWNGGVPERYRGGDIGSHVGLNDALNRNFQQIASALSGAVSRGETRPMMDELDMDSHRLTGVKSMLDPGCPWAGPLDLTELNNLVTLAGMEDPDSLTFCVMRASVQEEVQAPYYAPGWCETYNLTSKLYPLLQDEGMSASMDLLGGFTWGIPDEELAASVALLDGVLRDPIVLYDHTPEPEELKATIGLLDGVLRAPLVTYDHRNRPEELTATVSMLDGDIAAVLITYDHRNRPEELTATVSMLDGTLT